MHESLHMSATQIAEQIRYRLLTVTEVVDAHIKRIERMNFRINAVVIPMYEQAREQAQQADTHILEQGTDNLPPLFGVPITIKDSFPIEGIRFTAGSYYLQNNIAKTTAPSVQKLIDAGAIILGKTNLPDMCWLGETVNPVFGRTRNPHDKSRMVGGSSGGEGAIIAAGGSPLGLGSDIAGSVRIPASANGCVSLKPTGGRISNIGHLPKPADEISDWSTVGPMARRVQDLYTALSVLSETPVKALDDISLQGKRIIVDHDFRMSRRMQKTIWKSAGVLNTLGMEIRNEEAIPIPQALLAYFALFEKYNAQPLAEALGGGEAYQLRQEIMAHINGQGHISPSVLFFNFGMRLFGKISRVLGYANWDRLDRIRQQFLDLMGDGGVILAPVLMDVAPHHGWTWSMLTSLPITPVYNALGFPSVVIPVAWTDDGLPMGVQIVARPNEDEVAIAIAQELENHFGGWRMARV